MFPLFHSPFLFLLSSLLFPSILPSLLFLSLLFNPRLVPSDPGLGGRGGEQCSHLLRLLNNRIEYDDDDVDDDDIDDDDIV